MEPWKTQWRPAPAHLCHQWRTLSKKAQGTIERLLVDVADGDPNIFLSDCELGDVGMQLVVEALKRHRPGPKNINFINNGLTDAGAVQLARALEQFHSVEIICLQYNRIGDDGACEFARILENLPELKMISLDHNLISDVGASRLLSSLAWNYRPSITCSVTVNPLKTLNVRSMTNLTVPANTVRTLSLRGVTLGQMLTVYNDGVAQGIIDPDTTTTEDVAQLIIHPATKASQKSYVETMGFENAPPTAHVIHSWSCLFSTFLRNLSTHVTGVSHPTLNLEEPLWQFGPAYKRRSFFVDVFCVNQQLAMSSLRYYGLRDDHVFPSGEPWCEIDKLHLVAERIQRRGGQILLCIDPDYVVTSRFLCLAEIHSILLRGGRIDVIYNVLCPPPPGRTKVKVLESRAFNERERQIALDDIRDRLGGIDEFDRVIQEFLDDQWSQRLDKEVAKITKKIMIDDIVCQKNGRIG